MAAEVVVLGGGVGGTVCANLIDEYARGSAIAAPVVARISVGQILSSSPFSSRGLCWVAAIEWLEGRPQLRSPRPPTTQR